MRAAFGPLRYAHHLGVNSTNKVRSSLIWLEYAPTKRIRVMTDIALKAQEETLSFDVSDETLEVAAGVTKLGASFTLGSCTGLSECPA
jgi:hypothetical protein